MKDILQTNNLEKLKNLLVNINEKYYIELKKNRIYDITASWAEEKLEENGFYGEAEYFIVTE